MATRRSGGLAGAPYSLLISSTISPSITWRTLICACTRSPTLWAIPSPGRWYGPSNVGPTRRQSNIGTSTADAAYDRLEDRHGVSRQVDLDFYAKALRLASALSLSFVFAPAASKRCRLLQSNAMDEWVGMTMHQLPIRAVMR
jgi:hypothetical protein